MRPLGLEAERFRLLGRNNTRSGVWCGLPAMVVNSEWRSWDAGARSYLGTDCTPSSINWKDVVGLAMMPVGAGDAVEVPPSCDSSGCIEGAETSRSRCAVGYGGSGRLSIAFKTLNLGVVSELYSSPLLPTSLMHRCLQNKAERVLRSIVAIGKRIRSNQLGPSATSLQKTSYFFIAQAAWLLVVLET